MAALKAKSNIMINNCEKCGSSMRPRMLAVRNNHAFIRILQCSVCRHWKKIK